MRIGVVCRWGGWRRRMPLRRKLRYAVRLLRRGGGGVVDAAVVDGGAIRAIMTARAAQTATSFTIFILRA